MTSDASERARELRERLLLAVAIGDAAMALEGLTEAVQMSAEGYSLLVLEPGQVGPTLTRPCPARHAGRCVVCDQPIGVGQMARMRDADRALVHVACAEVRR